ncbi:MAG: tRNA uridine-5-carboxymethylaminomethyl(34) synthesis enzyme MnmG [Christensenellaceae bacterium]|jgi:tRNA uridine 5-carboxymethylaminomethyl modification enzyme|nr:tRNA uridine-5-carboxymethylaminomethyl(34) synthesis enzyme MnmG [Christensenellaceae bacterium]
MDKYFDAIVVGAGHAGVEAAHALAVCGKKTLLLSLSLDSVSFMACNPNVGGSAKGHLVKEVDALGGLMGEIADRASLQIRMLNLSNGPAVHSLRAQVDKSYYHRLMKSRLESTVNLTLKQADVSSLIIGENGIAGVCTAMGDSYYSSTVILATGVYLNSKIITGNYQKNSGPNGFSRSELLTANLVDLGLPIRRFKTGTPPRVLGRSVDFSKMTVQSGDIDSYKFSSLTEAPVRNDHACYLTYTNSTTHEIIIANLDKAPLYNGSISGIGPRYCPSIEDKVVRFADKDRHQIFIEPEGADTNEMYVQGLSTSLPFDIQEQIVSSIQGLEHAVITRYGYAIEYDCLDPLALYPTLQVKSIAGLFSAGQINGSSGYEEAASQGLIAGINASKYLDNKPGFVLRRDEAYIGVMIDDLVTNGTNEPYRMMTSRAEYRLHLRQDNADLRLTELGREAGTVDNARYQRLERKREELVKLASLAAQNYEPNRFVSLCQDIGESLPKSGISLKELLQRPNVQIKDAIKYFDELKVFRPDTLQYFQNEIKYEGYLLKQEKTIEESKRMLEHLLPSDIDYLKISGLRLEARQKLNMVKPLTLQQASRISGVTPADITVLILNIKKKLK